MKKELERYLHAYITINGVINLDILVDVLNKHHNLNVTKEELIKLAEVDYQIKNDSICLVEVNDEDFELLNSKKEKQQDMYIIKDLEEVERELEEYDRYLEKILTDYKLEVEVITIFNTLMQNAVFMENAIPFVLAQFNIKMPLKKQHKLYEDLRKSTKNRRLWYLNGFKLNEVKQDDNNIKVGRNDLCSCGSGRKYKKCCGK